MTFQAKLRLDFNIKVFWNVILSNVSHGIIFIWQKLKEIGSMEPQFWLVDFLWSTTMNHLSSLTFSWLFGLMEDDICVGWCNVLGPWNDVFWSKNECASCWIQVGRPCNCVWKMEVENIQMVLQLAPMHKSFVTLAKWGDLGRFGMVRSRETTFMLNTFSFEACIMMNFQLEVWEIKHIWKFSKSQVKCSLFPPWITFSMDFKWEAFFNESCSSFKPIQFSHKFDLIWILHEGVMHFRSWGISLVQWTWAKMTYNVSSWHMHFQVEFELPPNIKVEVNILNLIIRI